MRPLRKVRTENRQLAALQDAVEQSLGSLPKESIVLRSQSLVSASTNKIGHGLGRKLSGWKVVRRRADSRVWDDQDNNPTPELTLWLKCSADVVVDLEVT